MHGYKRDRQQNAVTSNPIAQKFNLILTLCRRALPLNKILCTKWVEAKTSTPRLLESTQFSKNKIPNADKNRVKRKKSPIGCLFWIAAILLVLVIFLFNRDTINRVMENTGFWEVVSRDKEPLQITEHEQEVPEIVPSDQIKVPNVEEEIPIPLPPTTQEETPEPEPPTQEPAKTAKLEPEEPELTQEVESTPRRLRSSKLYFVRVNEEGQISLQGIERPVYYDNSPLTETLGSLIKGLSTQEINQGLISLIPEGTRILGVSIKNNTAILNFSEEFLFNSFGKEGYIAQLQQLIYTATEFSTVDRVQFLIAGEARAYMGSEGISIQSPLDRNSL